MRSSSGDSWPGGAINRLVVLLFVSAEDRIRQVEECGRSGCQDEFSVPWLHSAVYELFVEPAMTKECVSSDATSSSFDICEKNDVETSIFRVLCVSGEHLYSCTHTSTPLICGERHMIADFWWRWESASQRCVSCLLTRAENRSHAWSRELVSCLVL